jgi:hypothetical protein
VLDRPVVARRLAAKGFAADSGLLLPAIRPRQKAADVDRVVRRFEQISGCLLASTESLAEVWLALRTTAAVPENARTPT